MFKQRFPLDQEQIGDGIDPSSRQGAMIDLGAAFEIDELSTKEILADIEGGNGDLGPGGEQESRSLF